MEKRQYLSDITKTRTARVVVIATLGMSAVACGGDMPSDRPTPPPTSIESMTPSVQPTEAASSPLPEQTNEACGLVPVQPGDRLSVDNLSDAQAQLETLQLALSPNGEVGFRDPDRAIAVLVNAKRDPIYAASFASVIDSDQSSAPGFDVTDLLDSNIAETIEYCEPARETDPVYLTRESASAQNNQILKLGTALGQGLGSKVTDQTAVYIKNAVTQIEPYAERLVDGTVDIIQN